MDGKVTGRCQSPPSRPDSDCDSAGEGWDSDERRLGGTRGETNVFSRLSCGPKASYYKHQDPTRA